MTNHVTESHFYMWRALFALVHADDEVHSSEVRFMAEALEDNDFSDAQRVILNNDMHERKDIMEMFARVTEAKDRAQFFQYARDVVWADGSFGEHEQAIMLELQKVHMQDANVDDLIGQVNLEIEGEAPRAGKGQSGRTGYLDDEDFDVKPFSFIQWFKDLFK